MTERKPDVPADKVEAILRHKEHAEKMRDEYMSACFKAEAALAAIGLLCPECRKKDVIRHLINTGKSK